MALTITKSKSGFKMPDFTNPKKVNPNDNPEKYFKHIRNINSNGISASTKLQNLKTFVLADHSGSNRIANRMMAYIGKHLLSGLNTDIIPFGSIFENDFRVFNSSNYNPYSRENFKWGTHTTIIEKFFENYLPSTNYINGYYLVVISDGEFSDRKFIDIIEDASRRGLLDKCLQLTILFSPHTFHRTEDKLVNELTRICNGTANIIPIICHHISNYYLTPNDINVINKIGTVSPADLPPNHIRVGDWIMHKDITVNTLTTLLINNKIAAEELLKVIQEGATISPRLLISHPYYGIIYRALCSQRLFGNELIVWMNKMVTAPTTSQENRKIIQQLIDTSRSECAKQTLLANLKELQEQNLIIGFLPFVDGALNPDEIRNALKNMDFSYLIKTAKRLVNTSQHKIVQYKDVKVDDIIGLPILDTNKATSQQCFNAFRLMFCQFGNDLYISGMPLYITILSMLLSETEVNRLLYQQLEKALFDNLDMTLSNLGINTETNEWNKKSHDLITHPVIVGLLARAITYYGDRMFPNIDIHDTSLIATTAYNEILNIARSYMISLFVSNVSTLDKYKFTLENVLKTFSKVPNSTYKRGVICAVKPFPNRDPHCNLPSVVYIVNCVFNNNNGKAFLEYLDRPMGTGDTVNLNIKNLIPLFNLGDLPMRDMQCILKDFNKWLCKMQTDGASGKLGEKMLMGAELDQELYDTNMQSAIEMLTQLILDYGHNPETLQVGGFMPVSRNPTRAEVIDIITDLVALTPEAREIYIRGNNLNSQDIEKCKVKLPGQTAFTPSGIPPEYVSYIREELVNALKPKPIAHLKIGTIATCACCLDTLNFRHIVKLSCTHGICNECYQQMVNYRPELGEPVNQACCRCPQCKQVLPLQNARLAREIEQFQNIAATEQGAILMYCSVPDCRNPYYVEIMDCAGNIDTIPRLCIHHRPVETHIKIVSCPGCNVSIERSDGCDVVECECGQKFCFGCGASLPYDTYHWVCSGSYDECMQSAQY